MSGAEIRAELLKVTRRAYFQDHMFAATSGNLSVYDRQAGHMYITPGSFPYEDMTEDDMMVIDLDGNVLEGKHKPSSEWKLHAAIYRNFENVCAVVHTHSPYATSFAINHMNIPVVLYEIAWFLGGDIPVAEGALPGSPEVGENCVKVLKDRNGCLMGNHGAVAMGETLAQAYTRAVYIEDAAKAYSLALTHGPVKVVESAEVRRFLGKE
ncbi:MAG: class II aldolase/adducin family protein [Clostridia bacterium]|nr:class II aldolase/adducin family protein [Clostridia bacterium]